MKGHENACALYKCKQLGGKAFFFFAQGDFVTQILAAERRERYFVCPCLP